MFSRTKIFREVDNNLPLAVSILVITGILGYWVVDYIITHVTAGNRQIMGTFFLVAIYAWIIMTAMAVIYAYRSVRALQKSRKSH